MPNYQQAKIYKLISAQTQSIYIGSTTKDLLSKRMSGHRYMFTKWQLNRGRYVTSFEILQHDDAQIVLLEDYPTHSIDNLRSRERYWIEQTENCINRNLPGRTKEEYEKFYSASENGKARHREWERNNRDKIRASRERRKDQLHEWQKIRVICECGREFSQSNKSQHIKSKIHKKWEEDNIGN